MCGLFGFISCDGFMKNAASLTNSLAEHSAVRGTDATGIAFVRNGIQINKEGKSAYSINFKHPDSITALIGHTRHATQGDAKKNYNNHPFFGKAGGTRFALAHNGVLMDHYLSLPKTKIETDSYAAVQLIEQEKELSFTSIRKMAETVTGSFAFSILDEHNNLWLVKGDSPLSILYFSEKKMYVYASTDEILYKSIVDSLLFDELKHGRFEEIPIEEGTIMKITPDGIIETERFKFSHRVHKPWWEYGYTTDFGPSDAVPLEDDYLTQLKYAAMWQGIEPETIDEMLDQGYTLDELEEAIYEI